MSYREAMEMPSHERDGILLALREMNGYSYLGKGRWKEPSWMTEQKAAAEKARRKESKTRR